MQRKQMKDYARLHWTTSVARPLFGFGMLGHQFLVFLPQSVHPINHLLDELHLRVSKPMLVRDVVSDASLSTRLSPSSTGLDLKLLASGLECRKPLFGPSRQVHVDGSPHSSAQVGGAGM